jgi:DDE superfamily endonuclease
VTIFTTTTIQPSSFSTSHQQSTTTHNNRNRMADSDDNSDGGNVTHIVTVDMMISIGLRLLNYAQERIDRAALKTNVNRFTSHFGVRPSTACTVYEDLQKTAIVEARLTKPSPMELKNFLIGLNYLRKYPKEDELEATFNYSKGWISKKVWKAVKRIQCLAPEKIIWPDDLGENELWVLTVDGIHMWIKEPTHPEWSQDPEAFSHKYNHAGACYEVGVSLTGGLIWLNGPFKAGSNDMRNFKSRGLMARLLQLGKKAIGDSGYNGRPDAISTPNSHDSKSVYKFKSRALERHESFNGLTKQFEILAVRFRHSLPQLKMAYEAVAILCQYKLENELPLYDILIEDVLNADGLQE